MDQIDIISDILEKNGSSEQRNVELNKYFGFVTDSQSKQQIMGKLYDSIIAFSNKDLLLHNTKIACLLLIITEIQCIICSNKYTSPIEAFEIFKQLLIKYSVQRPPYSMAIFAFQDLLPITEFILTTLRVLCIYIQQK